MAEVSWLRESKRELRMLSLASASLAKPSVRIEVRKSVPSRGEDESWDGSGLQIA